MARTNKYTSINFNDIYDKKVATTTTTAAAASPSSSGRYSSSPSFASHSHLGKSYSLSAASRPNGMLLLSRPTPKPPSQPQPVQQPPPQPQPLQHQHQSPLPSPFTAPQTPPPSSTDLSRKDSESISLRPLGKTGGPLISSPSSPRNPNTGVDREKEFSPISVASPKSDRFVPPHLRPGFVAKEGRPATPPSDGRGRDFVGHRPGAYGSPPNRYFDDGRPKSGGGGSGGVGGGYQRSTVRRGAGIGGGGHDLDPRDVMMMNRPRSGGTRPISSG